MCWARCSHLGVTSRFLRAILVPAKKKDKGRKPSLLQNGPQEKFWTSWSGPPSGMVTLVMESHQLQRHSLVAYRLQPRSPPFWALRLVFSNICASWRKEYSKVNKNKQEQKHPIKRNKPDLSLRRLLGDKPCTGADTTMLLQQTSTSSTSLTRTDSDTTGSK